MGVGRTATVPPTGVGEDEDGDEVVLMVVVEQGYLFKRFETGVRNFVGGRSFVDGA